MIYPASQLASPNAVLAKRIEINTRSDFITLNLNRFDYKQFKNLFSVSIGSAQCHICFSSKR